MKLKRSIDQRLRRRLLPLIFLIATVLMGISLYLRIASIREHGLQLATESARNIFRMIVLTRQWNAEHSGVYVFATDTTPSNPYLQVPQRDIPVNDDKLLTLINPAYMTREIAELAAVDPQMHIQLHITSLNPIRPDNQADEWETQALQLFERGQKEHTSIVHQESGNQLRYMAPLMVKPACLNCHAKQGYQVGDVRGGISVSLPLTTVEATLQNEILASWLSHAVSYFLLIMISWGLLELLARRWRALDETIEILQATRNELVENEKMASLGRLVAGFAHELNTPVGVAVGAISHSDETLDQLDQLLTQDEVPEQLLNQRFQDLRESHTLALSNLRRAAELVHRFKRTSIDRGSAQKRIYQLRELINDVLISLHNSLKHTAVNVAVECRDDIQLYGTPGLLEQVLTNLITNSLTHGYENGKRAGQIHIKAEISKNHRLLIDFQDDGVGMPEEVRQQAFEPFFTTNREHGGSGLGLYVIYNIITQQMNGSIQILSTVNVGTEFKIDCPIEESPTASES